jgi:hypothetical protein
LDQLDGVFRHLIEIEIDGRRDDRWVEVGGFVYFELANVED